MATKDRRKLQHIHSSIADKQPTPQSLEVGEIAVNNAANKEFLSLKNSNDKVVRFSSDSTIIDWMEKKEVMPYSGVVDNVHLDTNRSNIEIKINQVAAKNTPKYDKINGAVDIDGQPINPSTDSGMTDGAGIAIDMSRYAMIGANPSFSSITVTHRSNLSGTTNISNGAGGTALNITTTDVTANDTNWTETITNKKSTVTTEEDKIGTLNESATTRTTVVGTESLTVNGTTTEIHTGNVGITNSSNVTETTNGTTTETKVGNVVENNQSNKTETTTGAVTENNKAGYTVNTTGDTCLQSTADVNVGGAANTNIGTNCDDSVKANYVNIKAKSGITETANTVTISGTTSANISGATVNVSGGSINETSSGKTCITAGSDLNIGGDANTNIGYNCAGTGIANNTNIFASTAVTINAPTTNITGNTYLSGNTYFHKTCTGLTNNEIDAAFCEVLSRGAITIEKNTSPTDPQLATVYTIKQNGAVINTIEVAKDQFLQNAEVVKNTSGEWVIRLTWWIYDPDSGTHTTATTDVNASELVKDLTAVNPSDNGTALNHNVSVNAWYDSTSGDMKFSAETTPNMHVGNMYVSGTTSASTVSGTNVNGGTISGTTVKGVTISGTNITASAAIKANNVSANTISAASSINTSDLYASGTVSGATVSGTTVKGATVSAGTLTATGNTTLASASASSVSATSISSPTISGTNITASAAIKANNVSASTISATTFTGAMSKKLTWAAGAFTADTTGYNGSADKTITVPTAISHLATRGKLTITHNGLSDTYDPASDKSMALPHSALSFSYGSVSAKTGSDSYNTSAAKSITIPTSIDDLKNYNGTCVEIPHNVCVTGTITSSGAIYSSDMNLKENINDVERDDYLKAKHINAKSFNFKSDGSKRKVYGVIAQDVQDVGLNNLVHTDEDGNLGVDYTSLLILKIAYLENLCNHLQSLYADLNNKINEIENKG